MRGDEELKRRYGCLWRIHRFFETHSFDTPSEKYFGAILLMIAGCLGLVVAILVTGLVIVASMGAPLVMLGVAGALLVPFVLFYERKD